MPRIEIGSPLFLGVLDNRLSQIGREASALPLPSGRRCVQLQAEMRDITMLVADITQYAGQGWSASIAPARDPRSGSPIPNHQVMCRGDWEAYFRAEHGGRVMRGVLICDRRLTPAQQLVALIQSVP